MCPQPWQEANPQQCGEWGDPGRVARRGGWARRAVVSRLHGRGVGRWLAAELAKLEACVAELGEALRSVYDEAYIAQKEEALREARIPLMRLEMAPEDRSIAE